MEDQLVIAVEKAIDLVVADFQGAPTRFFNERDLHWRLFYHLRQQAVFQHESSVPLIRAEFPTRKKYEGRKPARGHYDLVVLDPVSYNDRRVTAMKPWEEWEPYLKLVDVLVAVEVKMLLHRWSDRNLREVLEWDVEKLTDKENGVRHPYLLNFVQFDFSKPHLQDFYQKLRDRLAEIAEGNIELKILYAPSDVTLQAGTNWIAIRQL